MDSGVIAQRGYTGLSFYTVFAAFCLQLIRLICSCLLLLQYCHSSQRLLLETNFRITLCSRSMRITFRLSLCDQKLIDCCVGLSYGTIAWER